MTDVYVNVFFGFPWSDVPDCGMTIQAQTNDDPELARRVARDMADYAWRNRKALLETTRVHTIQDGVTLAREAVSAGRAPVVLADHSDRSGYATWLLREIIAQGLGRTLVATVAAPDAVAALLARSAKPGDPFDMEIGGRVDPSAGDPVRIAGTVLAIGAATTPRAMGGGDRWICVGFGDGNVVVLSPFLAQILEPSELWGLGLDPDAFDVIAIKSRVHFRRGFDDSGFAQTILVVEPPQSFLGTIRLDGLAYRNLKLTDFYPYGDPVYPAPGDPA